MWSGDNYYTPPPQPLGFATGGSNDSGFGFPNPNQYNTPDNANNGLQQQQRQNSYGPPLGPPPNMISRGSSPFNTGPSPPVSSTPALPYGSPPNPYGGQDRGRTTSHSSIPPYLNSSPPRAAPDSSYSGGPSPPAFPGGAMNSMPMPGGGYGESLDFGPPPAGPPSHSPYLSNASLPGSGPVPPRGALNSSGREAGFGSSFGSFDNLQPSSVFPPIPPRNNSGPAGNYNSSSSYSQPGVAGSYPPPSLAPGYHSSPALLSNTLPPDAPSSFPSTPSFQSTYPGGPPARYNSSPNTQPQAPLPPDPAVSFPSSPNLQTSFSPPPGPPPSSQQFSTAPPAYHPPPRQPSFPPPPSHPSTYPPPPSHPSTYPPPPPSHPSTHFPPPPSHPSTYASPSGPPPSSYPAAGAPPSLPERKSSNNNRINGGGYSYGPPLPEEEKSVITSPPPTGPPDFEYLPPGPAHMPPSQPQSFGTPVQTPGGGQQTAYQYSQCTGKKRALCIGINYFGTPARLNGCINDANNIRQFIISKFGYKDEDIVVLTDDTPDPVKQPTKVNIIRAMKWLVKDARPNDSLFFHFSGHGGYTKDKDGDEADGYDEVIYPVDFKKAGHIVDDYMHDVLVKPLPAGCRLTAIFDSCHSGSALDLPYVYSTEGTIKQPNVAAETAGNIFGVALASSRGDIGGLIKGVSGLVKNATGANQRAEEYARKTKSSPADVISWAGCKDSQTSADTEIAGQATGAMSHAFMTALNARPQQTFQQLLISIRQILREKYSQKPQLSSSHPMDINILFIA